MEMIPICMPSPIVAVVFRVALLMNWPPNRMEHEVVHPSLAHNRIQNNTHHSPRAHQQRTVTGNKCIWIIVLGQISSTSCSSTVIRLWFPHHQFLYRPWNGQYVLNVPPSVWPSIVDICGWGTNWPLLETSHHRDKLFLHPIDRFGDRRRRGGCLVWLTSRGEEQEFNWYQYLWNRHYPSLLLLPRWSIIFIHFVLNVTFVSSCCSGLCYSPLLLSSDKSSRLDIILYRRHDDSGYQRQRHHEYCCIASPNHRLIPQHWTLITIP